MERVPGPVLDCFSMESLVFSLRQQLQVSFKFTVSKYVHYSSLDVSKAVLEQKNSLHKNMSKKVQISAAGESPHLELMTLYFYRCQIWPLPLVLCLKVQTFNIKVLTRMKTAKVTLCKTRFLNIFFDTQTSFLTVSILPFEGKKDNSSNWSELPKIYYRSWVRVLKSLSN